MSQINSFGAEKTTVVFDDFVPLQSQGGVSAHATAANIATAQRKYLDGWWNYHPSDFGVARNYVSADNWLKIVNDGAGPAATYGYKPGSIADVFNTTTGQIDFTELSLGDMFDFRIDLDITTTVINQEVSVRGEFGIGGNAYTVSMASLQRKTAGTYQLSTYRGGPIASENTRTNPAELQIHSNADFTFKVQMLYFRVLTR